MSPSPTGGVAGPLRPSLQRANASAQSVSSSILDGGASDASSSSSSSGKRRPSMSTARMAALNAASAHSSPLNSPTMLRTSSGNQQQLRSYFDGAMAAVDMMRSDSSESQRSLKTKSSRKELRELARSATPSKGRSSNGDSHDDYDDDARSIDSFTCSYSSEFDRAQSRATAINGHGHPHQGWLDATFRKLSQKSGARARAVMPTIKDVDVVTEAEAIAAKTKAHFLDFSAIISPIPTARDSARSGSGSLAVPTTAGGTLSTNSTPRPGDYSRFPSPLPEHPAGPLQQQTLRNRRSEDSLTVRRRAQRQFSASTASDHSFSPPSNELPLPAGQHFPVPQLPDWARMENRRAHGSASSTEMMFSTSNDAASPYVRRPVDMSRAASHDVNSSTSLQLSLGPSLMSNFEGWKVSSISSEGEPLRSHSSLELHHTIGSRPSIPPLSFHRQQASYEEISPKKRMPSMLDSSLNRGSVSSATSDSDISSSVSSVPQTPVSRFTTLSASAQQGSAGPTVHRDSQTNTLYYDMADAPNVFDVSAHNSGAVGAGDEQDHLATIRARWLDGSDSAPARAATTGPCKTAPPPPPSAIFMTPRFAATRAGQHVARVFEEEKSAGASQTRGPSHAASTSISHASSDRDGDETIRAPGAARPRAVTLGSSMGPPAALVGAQSPTKHSGAAPAMPLSTPISPSRTSSLHHARKSSASSNRRTSIASNASAVTTASSNSSSSTTSSGASALLSYMRSRPSKSHSNLAGLFDRQPKPPKNVAALPTSTSSSSSSSSKAPSSSGTVRAPSSPNPASSRRGGGVLAEEMAASISRRFGRNIAATAGGSD